MTTKDTNRSGNLRGKYKRSPYKDIKKIRKQQIIDFVKDFVFRKKYSPTYNEIAEGIGYSYESQGTIYPWVQELIAAGWLKHTHEGGRSLVAVDKPEGEYFYRREDAIQEAKSKRTKRK